VETDKRSCDLTRAFRVSQLHDDAALQALADKSSPAYLARPARLDMTARELVEYFVGRRCSFDLPQHWRLAAWFRHDAEPPARYRPRAPA
jgi:hypothetical protein